MTEEIHIHIHHGEVKEGRTPRRRSGKRASPKAATKKRKNPGAGLPKKYAKMGFKKGWREYKKTAGYKRKAKAAKKRKR